MSGPRWPSPAVTRACLCSLIRLWVTSLITSWFLFSSCKIPYNVMSMQCQYISSNHYMCLQTLDNDVNIYMYMQHQLWLTFSDLWLFCFIMFLHMLSSCFRDGNTQAPYLKKKIQQYILVNVIKGTIKEPPCSIILNIYYVLPYKLWPFWYHQHTWWHSSSWLVLEH